MSDGIDNIEIAVLTKLNELAARFGLKPYHFIATLESSSEMNGLGVRFVVPAETGQTQEKLVRKMIATLGADPRGVLTGGEIAVIDALDRAVGVAPKPRSR
jgi:hypothetical protein